MLFFSCRLRTAAKLIFAVLDYAISHISRKTLKWSSKLGCFQEQLSLSPRDDSSCVKEVK